MMNSQEVYTQLWNEHFSDLRNYCYIKLKGRSNEADDILRTAYSELWEKLLNGELMPNPKAWLYKTIDRIIKDKSTDM